MNDNYTDSYISIHTSGQYCLFILSARLSAALNSQARDSRINSDWVSMFVSFITGGKKYSESDSKDIIFLCLYRYSCGVDSAII